jgi:hypothetical protein
MVNFETSPDFQNGDHLEAFEYVMSETIVVNLSLKTLDSFNLSEGPRQRPEDRCRPPISSRRYLLLNLTRPESVRILRIPILTGLSKPGLLSKKGFIDGLDLSLTSYGSISDNFSIVSDLSFLKYSRFVVIIAMETVSFHLNNQSLRVPFCRVTYIRKT